jgi:hypothetical protein
MGRNATLSEPGKRQMLSKSKLKVSLLLITIVFAGVTAYLLAEAAVPTEPEHHEPRYTLRPVRSAAPPPITPTLDSAMVSVPSSTPAPLATRTIDATPLPQPVFVPLMPPYGAP